MHSIGIRFVHSHQHGTSVHEIGNPGEKVSSDTDSSEFVENLFMRDLIKCFTEVHEHNIHLFANIPSICQFFSSHKQVSRARARFATTMLGTGYQNKKGMSKGSGR
ncbi:unnamed protein product [Dicrocoelium dendriticum]|nr:unnamed protein product [Dicrocoelium dendriticum]